MEHGKSIKPGIHYHIRWSNSSVDWKPFPKREDAIELAGQIRKPSESYMIVEGDSDCERCKAFKSGGKNGITNRSQAITRFDPRRGFEREVGILRQLTLPYAGDKVSHANP
jgi:hypothetical protein